uniref:PCI domain-containing protein n=1 Tax=Peronospora matthiolae TaxID=2874970 RepID=A0AAV1VEM9_9STRA
MNTKLGKLYLDMHNFDQLQKLLQQLYAYCQTSDGEQDNAKATSLLEVYALEIQLCVATKNSIRMRAVYPKTLDLDAAVADPRVIGFIREEGGKMYLEEKEWMLAYNEFFEGFRNYQEAGNSRATQCLKYVVLANMLTSSNINPFDSREAKVYQDVEEVGAMLLLRSAYEANDIVQFEKVLKNPSYKLLSDPIMNQCLNPLLRNIRCQAMKTIVRPYRTIRVESLSKRMNITTEDVEDIAIALIQNCELDAKIDQSRGFLSCRHDKSASNSLALFSCGCLISDISFCFWFIEPEVLTRRTMRWIDGLELLPRHMHRLPRGYLHHRDIRRCNLVQFNSSNRDGVLLGSIASSHFICLTRIARPAAGQHRGFVIMQPDIGCCVQ